MLGGIVRFGAWPVAVGQARNWPLLLMLLWLPAPLLSASALEPASTPVDPELRRLLAEAMADTGSFTDRFDAEVWLVDMSGRLKRWLKDPQERLTILRGVHREATRARLEPELVLALITVESGFDRFAISRAGAQGLMQIMPFWLDEIGSPEANLANIDTNLRMGCTILRHYIDIEKGGLFRALGRYNGSLGKAKYPAKVYKMRGRYWYRQ